jgi:hypothetical protein
VTLRDALEEVRAGYGYLSPETVVRAARTAGTDAEKLLRDRLEWDDAVAGEAYRRQQAHELIRSVRVVYKDASPDGPEQSVRAFQAVRRERGFVYEPSEEVAADPFTRRLVLADMEREWRALHARYSAFEEFAAIVRATLEGRAA